MKVVVKRPLPYYYVSLQDLPEMLDERLIYIIGEPNNVYYCCMLCPCGCNDKIYLSALPEDIPAWSVQKHRNFTITISPSVWRTKGCRSHFFIKRGNIIWV